MPIKWPKLTNARSSRGVKQGDENKCLKVNSIR